MPIVPHCSDQQLAQHAQAVMLLLQKHQYRLASAESCTGGWVAKIMTDLAGSSEVFECGFVTYSNAAKETLLDVQKNTLEIHGAVSEATVAEMVKGALNHSQTDIALAISGVAGPGGGSAEKPVGTVCFAWGGKDDKLIPLRTERCYFQGDREAVRRQSVAHALQALIQQLA